MKSSMQRLTPRLLGAASLCTLCGVAPIARAISPEDLAGRISRGEALLVVDVRPATLYEQGHVPGAINIPLSLLPHKQLPASAPVFICTDGLGAVSDAKALALVKAKPGVTADLIEGGYAAWLSKTRLVTEPPGVARERLPGITYQQLLAADRAGMVLVDLRSAPPAAAQSSSGKSTARTAAAERAMVADGAPDVLGGLASRLGVPVVSATAGTVTSAPAAAARQEAATRRTAAAAAPEGAAGQDRAAAAEAAPSDRLLVLVANTEAEAHEAARVLRASGNYRFTVLIGGIEIIQHEGRMGLERAEGKLPAVRSQSK